jgi:hypothetical protein
LAQRAYDRDRSADSIGNPLRQVSVNEYGVSSTYVVGTALELHAETSFRRDQRPPSVDSHVFQFTAPLPVAATLPIWSAGADAQLVETLVGGQYTFGDRTFLDGWNVIFEYDYQSEGWTKAQWNTFFDQVGRLQRLSAAATSGAPLPLPAHQLASDFGKRTADLFRDRPAFWGRHYGFLRVSRTDLGVDGLEVAVWTIPSLQDFSFVAGANVGYAPQSGFQLRLDMRYFGGPGRSGVRTLAVSLRSRKWRSAIGSRGRGDHGGNRSTTEKRRNGDERRAAGDAGRRSTRRTSCGQTSYADTLAIDRAATGGWPAICGHSRRRVWRDAPDYQRFVYSVSLAIFPRHDSRHHLGRSGGSWTETISWRKPTLFLRRPAPRCRFARTSRIFRSDPPPRMAARAGRPHARVTGQRAGQPQQFRGRARTSTSSGRRSTRWSPD